MKHGADNTTKLPFPTTILVKSYVGKTRTSSLHYTHCQNDRTRYL